MIKDIFDLNNNLLQSKVDFIRKLEGLNSIKITDKNVEYAIQYASAKSFDFFLETFIDSHIAFAGIISEFEIQPNSDLYNVDINKIDDIFKDIVKDTIEHSPLIKKAENNTFEFNFKFLTEAKLLYNAIINDPWIIYVSESSLKDKYNVSYAGAASFKNLLRYFHKARKEFEKTDNPFNK